MSFDDVLFVEGGEEVGRLFVCKGLVVNGWNTMVAWERPGSPPYLYTGSRHPRNSKHGTVDLRVADTASGDGGSERGSSTAQLGRSLDSMLQITSSSTPAFSRTRRGRRIGLIY